MRTRGLWSTSLPRFFFEPLRVLCHYLPWRVGGLRLGLFIPPQICPRSEFRGLITGAVTLMTGIWGRFSTFSKEFWAISLSLLLTLCTNSLSSVLTILSSFWPQSRQRKVKPDGRVAEWLMAADCKSARVSVHRFKSCPFHHLNLQTPFMGVFYAWKKACFCPVSPCACEHD